MPQGQESRGGYLGIVGAALGASHPPHQCLIPTRIALIVHTNTPVLGKSDTRHSRLESNEEEEGGDGSVWVSQVPRCAGFSTQIHVHAVKVSTRNSLRGKEVGGVFFFFSTTLKPRVQ